MIGGIISGGKRIFVASFILPLLVMVLGQDIIRLPPSITHTSRSQYFTGTTKEIILECKGKGSPRPKYKWKHNDEFLTHTEFVSYDEISGNLTISVPTRAVEGSYQCEASNKWGTSVSHPLYLTQARIGDFENKSEIAFFDVVQGDSLSLPCKNQPSSTPEVTYMWHSHSQDFTQMVSVTESDRMSVDANGTLHFAFTTSMDNERYYTCGVKNSILNTIRLGNKNRIRLNTGQSASNRLVTLLSGTKSKEAVLGNTVTLECIFAGNPAPEVTWNRKQKKLMTDDKYVIGPYGRKLTIKYVEESDGGLYTCEGSNTKDRKAVSIFVNVAAPPSWARPLLTQNIVEGGHAYFYCETKKWLNEMPEHREWYINGKMVNMIKGITADYNIKVYENYLIVENVSRDRHLMCIQCNVSNRVGSIFKDVYLNVLAPIQIHNKPAKYIYFSPGRTLNFSITATTDPSLKLYRKWYFNDQYLSFNQPYFDYYSDTGSLLLKTSQLSLGELSRLEGTYKCSLYHRYQSVDVSFTIFLFKDGDLIPESSDVLKQLVSKGAVFKFSSVNMIKLYTFIFAISAVLFW